MAVPDRISARAPASSRAVALLVAAATLSPSTPSFADEGGASLYLPGSFASMAAVPGVPGWSASLTYYHSRGSAKTVTETADLAYANVTYSFAEPVLGGQLAIGLIGALGGMAVTQVGTGRDSRLGVMDLTPAAALRWNAGVNNYLVYTAANAPSGTYNSRRLANFGINHWGQDFGAGYTYYDKDTGYEFSAVAGLTYNYENPKTKYRNGIDTHLDLSASRFFLDRFQLGLVGYVYEQAGSDGGRGATLGSYKSRVAAVGPQAGYLFPIGEAQGYLNLRAYREFASENRPAGWNLWLTVSVSPQAK